MIKYSALESCRLVSVILVKSYPNHTQKNMKEIKLLKCTDKKVVGKMSTAGTISVPNHLFDCEDKAECM